MDSTTTRYQLKIEELEKKRKRSIRRELKQGTSLESATARHSREFNVHPCPICQELHDVCTECGGSRLCGTCHHRVRDVMHENNEQGAVLRWLEKRFKERWLS